MGTPRGIRNNNPGNLRKSNEKWLGEIPGADSEFKTFSDSVYGLRAIAKLLVNYERKYGLNTISGLINRWAPTNENDTAVYIAAVAKSCGVSPGQPIEVSEYLDLLIPAIVTHENGQQPYSESQIAKAIGMVTGGDDAHTPVVASTSTQPAAPVLPTVPADVPSTSPSVGQQVGTPVSTTGTLTVGGIVLSKKLCALAGGVLVLIFGPALGLHLSPEQQDALTKALCTYLAAQGAADLGKPIVGWLKRYSESNNA